MKKYIICFAIAIPAGLILMTSCRGKRLRGHGSRTTTQVAISDVDTVDIDVSLRSVINVQAGSKAALSLAGYENILQHIKTRIVGRKLRIYSDLDEAWSLDKHDNTSAELTLPALASLNLSGASDVDIHGNVTGGELRTSISGSGKLVADNINVNAFYTDISGAADVEIKGGAVQKADFEISGAGKISSFPLQASDVNVSISGAAKADITAIKTLNVDINGAGKIKYKGHPTISKEISGAGTIRDVN